MNVAISDPKHDEMQKEIEVEIAALENWYAGLQSNFAVKERYDLKHLCDAGQNQNLPVYSWFNLKEAFAAEFPVGIVQYLQQEYDFHTHRVLDPFMGGGTTALSLATKGIDVWGVEYNPFNAWVSETKSLWQSYDSEEIRRALSAISLEVPKGEKLYWPKLSTFHNEKYFRKSDVRVFLFVLDQIKSSRWSNLSKRFLEIGVAKAITQVANLRKDGRALRYVMKDQRPRADKALGDAWQSQLNDLDLGEQDENQGNTVPTILKGSATDLMHLQHVESGAQPVSLANSVFDLVLYSPPYLNSFDYSEIYKLELWLLKFVVNHEDWRRVRLGTIRSHASVRFEETSHLLSDRCTQAFGKQLDKLGDFSGLSAHNKIHLPATIMGFFDDLYLALKEQFRVLRDGGFLVYLVANSRHSNLPIATDLLIGEIAKLIGFEAKELLILNKRNGRTKQKRFLRESVVILRKPYLQ